MRLLGTIALILLFLWLHRTLTSNDASHGSCCAAVSVSEAAVSLLLSPLSLYTWLTSTLLRLVLSVPALILSSIHYTLLLLLACPWCVASVFVSLLLMCVHVALYLLHVALVVCIMAVLILTKNKMADRDATKEEKMLYRQKKLNLSYFRTKMRMFGRRAARQG